jgi:hypothetical protein
LFLGISEIFAKGKKYAKMTFDNLDKLKKGTLD